MSFKSKNNLLKAVVISSAVMLVLPQTTGQAMHIMEGYLPVGQSVLWGIICVPFLVLGAVSMKKQMAADSKIKILLAMAGAFVFVLSSLKIPSVNGSCSHPTGTGFGAILFGPSIMAVLGIIVLLFQALLLAHGGLSTLGANTFSMAVAGPFVSYGIFKFMDRLRVPKAVSVFFAAALGDLFTYCVTSLQLAVGHPAAEGGVLFSFVKFLSIFALTQIPIAIAEGLLTVIIYNILEKNCRQELSALKVL